MSPGTEEKTLDDVVDSLDEATTAIETLNATLSKLRVSPTINVPSGSTPDVNVQPQIHVDMSKVALPAPQIIIRHPKTILVYFERGQDRSIKSPLKIVYEADA